MLAKCKKCGAEDEIALFSSVKRRTPYKDRFIIVEHKRYIDRRNRKRCVSTCYDCMMMALRKKRGTKPRLESTGPKIMKAVLAEKKAAKFFESLGFEVEHGHGAGPDLYCKMGKFTWTVEVKEARKSKVNSWRVNRVMPGRMSDELVGILLPNGRVYIDSMKQHLEKCRPNGDRTVSELVHIYGGVPIPKSVKSGIRSRLLDQYPHLA